MVDTRFVGAWRFAGFTLLADFPASGAWEPLPSPGDGPPLDLRLVIGADGSVRQWVGGRWHESGGDGAAGGDGQRWLHPDGRRLLVPIQPPSGSPAGATPDYAFLLVREDAEPGAAADGGGM